MVKHSLVLLVPNHRHLYKFPSKKIFLTSTEKDCTCFSQIQCTFPVPGFQQPVHSGLDGRLLKKFSTKRSIGDWWHSVQGLYPDLKDRAAIGLQISYSLQLCCEVRRRSPARGGRCTCHCCAGNSRFESRKIVQTRVLGSSETIV